MNKRRLRTAVTKATLGRSLKLLIGLPLSNAGRSATLEWFDFGPKSMRPSRRGDQSASSDAYVISTENAWHIAGPKEGIIVASQDRLYPAGNDPYSEIIDFDWDRQGANRCDERMQRFLDQHKGRPLTVKAVEVENWGGLKITLTHNYLLEIFTNTSLDSEFWRLFNPSAADASLVITAHGIER